MAKQYRKASKVLNRAVAIEPHSTEALFNLGLLFMRQEKYKEAAESLRRATDAAPRNVDAWVQLNKVLLYQERPDEALEISRVLQDLRPGAPGNDYFMQVAYRQKGEYEKAEASLRAFLAANPGFEPGYQELCEILLEQNPPQKEAAEEVIRQARGRGVYIPPRILDQVAR